MLSPPDVTTSERRRRFEELYAAHYASLLGYALRRTDNTDDAADVLAETFLAAWRRLDDIPVDPQARLWLYGTARRVLANQRRGELRRLALADRLQDRCRAWLLAQRGPDPAAPGRAPIRGGSSATHPFASHERVHPFRTEITNEFR